MLARHGFFRPGRSGFYYMIDAIGPMMFAAAPSQL
jgi:hypothetical protein